MELLALLLLTGVAHASAQGVSEYLKAGDAAFSRGEYNAAIQSYSSAIDGDSSSPMLYTKRAAAYISLRQQAQALRDLNKAVELDTSYVQGYLSRGKLHRSMCNVAAAERDLNKVLTLKPDHKTAGKELEVLSQIVWKLSEIEKQLESGDVAGVKAGLALLYNDAGDCVKAQMIEAQLWMQDKDYEQVAAATGRILKSDPGHLEALVLRGKAYYYLNDHEVAKRHFGEALKHDPDYGPARTEFNKVKAYDRKRAAAERAMEGGDWVAARAAFTEGLHLDPEHRQGNVALWIGLAKARGHLGQHDEAIEAWDAVLTLSPNNLDAKEQRIRLMMAAERYDQAVAAAREALHAHQDHHAFHHLHQEAEERQKMASRKDYYKILGVARDASEPEIKRAYRTLAKQLHPDKVSASEREASEARFRDVAEAYEVLTDEDKRRRFDNGEDLNDPHGGHGGGGFHPFHGFQQGGHNFHFQWG